MTPQPTFSDAELAQARALNRRLAWMPRFRKPGALRKFTIQATLRMSLLAPHGVPGVTTSLRRIQHMGESVALRILAPSGPSRGVYLDYHGGGWSIGMAAMDDRVNARIASELGLTVLSVDYGLLPEVSFDQMIAQCHAAADWAFEHVSEFGDGPIFIGGESAGAHLAAVTLLRLKPRPDFARLAGCSLFYGVYDLSSTPSVRAAKAGTLVLHGPSMRSGIASLLPGRDEQGLRDPAYSPLHADLRGLPPMLLLCGDIDPLVDDSKLFAERIRAAGGQADLLIAPEAPHAFNRLLSAMADRTNAYVRAWLADRMAAQSSSTAVAAE
jgi:acetyl esterase/lipase